MAPPKVAERKRLAKAGKANPDGSYPTNTKGRAVAAKAYSTDAVKAGRMSGSEKANIDARANSELGKSEPQKHTQVKSDRGDFAFKENRPNRKK